MPELPEVETTRKGIAPYVTGETVSNIIVRERKLRWPVPTDINSRLKHRLIQKLNRRAKYLLFYTDNGCLIVHLGMSGSLRIINDRRPPEQHDHIDLVFASGRTLRFRDPRKFGCLLWTDGDPMHHRLINRLGVEPLNAEFNSNYIYLKSRKRTQAIKTFIMDSRIVAGIGNIYANEALYLAGIHPGRKAGKLSEERYKTLVTSIKSVLRKAINKGGTTLRDFINGEGKPGYFRPELQVYDRVGGPCLKCKKPIRAIRLGQRSTFYCTACQH